MGMDALAHALLGAAVPQDHADNLNAMLIAGAGVVISAFVAWVTAQRSIRADERRTLRESGVRLLEWAIEYPFLESEPFCANWPEQVPDEDARMRYENYCCHVFNLLQHCWEFCGGDHRRMKHILYPDELIWTHRKWWHADAINQDAYLIGFQQYVAERIRTLTKEKTRGSQGPVD